MEKNKPIIKSLLTGNEFPWEDYKFGKIPKEEYPLTFIYKKEEIITYNISNFKLERFWFKGSKTINAGWQYKET
jgi:hypothetical protein